MSRARSCTRRRRRRCCGRCRARSGSTRPRRRNGRGATACGSGRGGGGGWGRRRRLRAAPLLVPWAEGSLGETPAPHAPAVVVPIPVEPSGIDVERTIAAITYGANPEKKGLDRVLAAWAIARRGDENLVVAGTEHVPVAPGVVRAGRLEPVTYRALLRRARVFVTAPRREDYGIAQLEALADGCTLVTTAAPGPYAALPLARALDPRLVVEPEAAALAAAIRAALDDAALDYAPRALDALGPFRRAAVDRTVAEELLPTLLGRP